MGNKIIGQCCFLGALALDAFRRPRGRNRHGICYINHPVQVSNVAILEKWATRQGDHSTGQ